MGKLLGYKKTALGWIPEEWSVTNFSQCLHDIIGGGTPSKQEEAYWQGHIPWATVKDLSNKNSEDTIDHITQLGLINSSAKLIPARVNIIATRMAVGSHSRFNCEVAINQDLKALIPNNSLLLDDYLQWILTYKKPYLSSLGGGSTVSGIRLAEIRTMEVALPHLPEQIKIAQILSTWDKAITQTQKLMEAKKRLKQGLMQKLLTKGVEVSLSQVLTRVGDPVTLEPDQIYREIGIRSHGKGLFIKEDTNAEKIGDKRVYWVQRDCFVLNIVFAWERAIAITSEKEVGCIASHRFPMYKPHSEKLNLRYLFYFFLSDKGVDLLKLASPGGAGRNKTLGQDNFKKTKITLPSIEEQNLIASTLFFCDQEIDLLQKKLSTIQRQKQGLMQKLLTGQIRVKVEN